MSTTTSATSASTSSPEWPVGSAMWRTPSSTVLDRGASQSRIAPIETTSAPGRQRPLGQLAQERAAGKQLQAGQPERRRHQAEQRRPGPLRRRPQHHQAPHPVPPAQPLQVVEPDQPAHRVADDVDPRDAGLRDDRLDLARDQAGRVADVADVDAARAGSSSRSGRGRPGAARAGAASRASPGSRG